MFRQSDSLIIPLSSSILSNSSHLWILTYLRCIFVSICYVSYFSKIIKKIPFAEIGNKIQIISVFVAINVINNIFTTFYMWIYFLHFSQGFDNFYLSGPLLWTINQNMSNTKKHAQSMCHSKCLLTSIVSLLSSSGKWKACILLILYL